MRKPLFKWLLRFLISAGMLYWLLHKTDFSLILKSFQNFSLFNLFIVLFLFTFTFILLSYKWKLLLPGYSSYLLMKVIFIGHFYSTVLPGQIAGEAAKAYILGRGKKNAEIIAASVLVDKITGLLGLLLVGIMGLILTQTFIPEIIIISIIALTILLLLSLFFLQIKFIHAFILKAINYLKSVFKFESIFRKIELLIYEWKLYSKKGRLLLISTLLGIAYQLISITVNVILSHAFGINVSFADWCWIAAILSFAILLPLSIGGIGIREGTLVGILSLVGVMPEKALALSFSIFCIILIFAIIGGIISNISINKLTIHPRP